MRSKPPKPMHNGNGNGSARRISACGLEIANRKSAIVNRNSGTQLPPSASALRNVKHKSGIVSATVARTLSFPQSTINSRLARIVTGLSAPTMPSIPSPTNGSASLSLFRIARKNLPSSPPRGIRRSRTSATRVSGGKSVNSVSSARRFNGDQGLRANPKPSAETEKHTCVATLTPRQAEIVGLLAKGLSDKEIAHNMDISEETVAYHLRVLFAHRHVHSRAGLLGTFAQVLLTRAADSGSAS